MGLDIAFNKAAALAAGIQTSAVRNGTDEDIAQAKAEGADAGYVEWLAEVVEVIHVPDTDLQVHAYSSAEDFFVRANKWGMVYAPLTQWLKSHGIAWSEL